MTPTNTQLVTGRPPRHLARLGLTAQRSLVATGQPQFSPWFLKFNRQLLQGTPAVLDLLAHNPFPDQPPRYVRAVLYDYTFTDTAQRSLDGAWWQRERLGLYLPPVSLDNFSQ